MDKLVDNSFKQYIESLMRKNILTNLNDIEFKRLMNMLEELINYIAIRFNFNLLESEKYIYQLKQNNNRDIYAIFNLLLPYIDDDNSFYLHKQIFYLSDITIKKQKDFKTKGFIEKSNNQKDDNITYNPYLITNLQYNKQIRNLAYLDTLGSTKIDMKNNELYNDLTKSQNIKDEDLNNDNKYFIEYSLTIDDILNNYFILLNTIDQISNKLYVNWINTRPLMWKNYKESRLYKNSFYYDADSDDILFRLSDEKKYKFGWYYPINDINIDKDKGLMNIDEDYPIDKYQGISCGDIYNMIHHSLYFDIKEFKWMIYEIPKKDIVEQGLSDQCATFWDYIKYKFNKIDEYIEKDFTYDEICNEDQKLVNEWLLIKENLTNNFTGKVQRELIYNVLYYIQRKYLNLDELLKSGYVKLPIKDDSAKKDNDLLLEIMDDKVIEITCDDIIKSWNSLDMKYLYKYLSDTIKQFKKTWYGYKMIVKKEVYPKLHIDEKIQNNKGTFRMEHKISYKNIYNWAKSILIYTYAPKKEKGKNFKIENMYYYQEYNWSCIGFIPFNLLNFSNKNLDYNKYLLTHKNKFIEAIRTKSSEPKNKQWFSIKSNLGRLYETADGKREFCPDLNNNIYRVIRKNIIDICFECLMIYGTLNEFVVDRECTDKAFLSNNYATANLRISNALKKNVFNSENIDGYNECIYYLTGEKYGNLPLITEKNKKPLKYFDSIVETDPKWYTFYAMDWICQISFFHKFINNRVMYITGATGQGKSTQIPKLLLYGLKMINFNNQGKVISTQPRVQPTKDNATEIAQQMGVPINAYSNTLETNLKTFFGYVQYKSQKDSHLNGTNDYYFKEMTDGSLVSDLYKNPILKKLEKTDKHNSENDKKLYTIKNLYDIIVIDESHEHNKNMDIILTLMKYATFWNNSLRLIIISATMKDDEPIYRRYYKDINDNMMFPLNLHNMNCNLYGYSKLDYTLDRTTVDRRLHISAPGETTQHKIDDIYLDVDTKDYKDAEEQGIKTVYKILETDKTGHLLFFTTGLREIRNLVELFNKTTEPYVIALPVYGELRSEWKDWATKTDKIHFFNINKADVYNEINMPGSGNKVPFGTYKQIIVVATNAAEASITIKGLKHVIDTGYYNSITYDSLTKNVNVKIAKISETSRVQRRGRVGRVTSGSVFYMYAKGKRSDIKSSYGICDTDFKLDMFKMMRSNSNENKIIDQVFNIYNFVACMKSRNMSNFSERDGIDSNDFHMLKYLMSKNDTYNKLEKAKPPAYDTEEWNNIIKVLGYSYMFHLLDSKETGYSVLYFGSQYLSEGISLECNFLHKPHDRYQNGYDISTLVDLFGTFYLIHPCETYATRHIVTGIIDCKTNNENNKFDKNFILKSFNYITNLFYSRMIISSEPTTRTDYSLKSFDTKQLLNYKISSFNYLKGMYKDFIKSDQEKFNILCEKDVKQFTTNDKFDKSEFANKLLTLYDKLDLTDIDSKDENLKMGVTYAIIYGILLGIEDEIIQTVAVLIGFNGLEMKNLRPTRMNNGRLQIDFKKSDMLLDQFKNNQGDLITLFNIFDKFNKDLDYIKKMYQPAETNEKIKLINKYEKIKLDYLKIKKNIMNNNNKDQWNINFNTNSNINFNDFLLLQKIDQKNDLFDKTGSNTYIKEVKTRIRFNLSEGDVATIIKWSNIRGLPYNNVGKMLHTYLDISNKIKMGMEDVDDVLFKWFKDNIKGIKKSVNLNDNIIKCFLYGFSENIATYNFKEKIFNNYITNEKMNVKKLFIGSPFNDSTIQPKRYNLFLSKVNNEPVNINNIEIEWLFEMMPDVYNSYNIEENYKTKTKNFDMYVDLLKFNDSYLTDKITNIDYNNRCKNCINDKPCLINCECKITCSHCIDKPDDKCTNKKNNNLQTYYSNYLKSIL
jgi:hypothetical protein